jgi:hypothetical protein
LLKGYPKKKKTATILAAQTYYNLSFLSTQRTAHFISSTRIFMFMWAFPIHSLSHSLLQNLRNKENYIKSEFYLKFISKPPR